MLPFDDLTTAVDGPKDARMELRTRKRVKDTIHAAAALVGVDDSAFALNAAYRAALETIRAHETTLVAGADRAVFFAALDNPPEPTAALRDAFDMHERLIGR
ncbi:MAG: DUF1778 domain-containing protein [Rhizobiaceae bacterium]|nr:DUF1778 domain-containing protein [Rhizobiaceae bacterium]